MISPNALPVLNPGTLCVTTGRPVGLMFSPVWSGFPSLKRVHADELSVCRRERKQSAVSYIFGPNVAAPLTVRSTSSLHVMNSRRICHLTWMDGCRRLSDCSYQNSFPHPETFKWTEIKDMRGKDEQTSLPLTEKCRELYLWRDD